MQAGAIIAQRLRQVAAQRSLPSYLHNYLGYAHRNLQDFDAAFRHTTSATIELEPRHRGAHECIGEAYLMVGDVPNGEKRLAALLAICLLSREQLTDLETAFVKYRR